MLSVSGSRSRESLETYEGLVSVSSRSGGSRSRSRLGLVTWGLGIGLEAEGLDSFEE